MSRDNEVGGAMDVQVEARPRKIGEDQAAEVRGARAPPQTPLTLLARGEEVFTVFAFVTSFSFRGGRKSEASYSQNVN